MVENNNVKEDNNVYCFGEGNKSNGGFSDFFFLKINLHQWWKTLMLKKTTITTFLRKAIVVINSYIWGSNQI